MPQGESLESRINAQRAALEQQAALTKAQEQAARLDNLRSQISQLQSKKEKLTALLADFEGGYNDAAQNLPEQRVAREHLTKLYNQAREVDFTQATSEAEFIKDQEDAKEVASYRETGAEIRNSIGQSRTAKQGIRENAPDIEFGPGVGGREAAAQQVRERIEQLDEEIAELFEQTPEGVEAKKESVRQRLDKEHGRKSVNESMRDRLVRGIDYDTWNSPDAQLAKGVVIEYHQGRVDDEVAAEKEKQGIAPIERDLELIDNLEQDRAEAARAVYAMKNARKQAVESFQKALDSDENLAATLRHWGYRDVGDRSLAEFHIDQQVSKLYGYVRTSIWSDGGEALEKIVNERFDERSIKANTPVPDYKAVQEVAQQMGSIYERINEQIDTDPTALLSNEPYYNPTNAQDEELASRYQFKEKFFVELSEETRERISQGEEIWKIKEHVRKVSEKIEHEGKHKKEIIAAQVEMEWADTARRLFSDKHREFISQYLSAEQDREQAAANNVHLAELRQMLKEEGIEESDVEISVSRMTGQAHVYVSKINEQRNPLTKKVQELRQKQTAAEYEETRAKRELARARFYNRSKREAEHQESLARLEEIKGNIQETDNEVRTLNQKERKITSAVNKILEGLRFDSEGSMSIDEVGEFLKGKMEKGWSEEELALIREHERLEQAADSARGKYESLK